MRRTGKWLKAWFAKFRWPVVVQVYLAANGSPVEHGRCLIFFRAIGQHMIQKGSCLRIRRGLSLVGTTIRMGDRPLFFRKDRKAKPLSWVCLGRASRFGPGFVEGGEDRAVSGEGFETVAGVELVDAVDDLSVGGAGDTEAASEHLVGVEGVELALLLFQAVAQGSDLFGGGPLEASVEVVGAALGFAKAVLEGMAEVETVFGESPLGVGDPALQGALHPIFEAEYLLAVAFDEVGGFVKEFVGPHAG